MNTQKLYRLVHALEQIGLSKEAAFEAAFMQYKAALKGGAA